MTTRAQCVVGLSAALLSAGLIVSTSPRAAVAAALPTRVGQCSEATIARLGPRLEGQPDSGSGVVYDNGGAQVSYEVIAGLARSRVGDRVRLCLVSVPKNCPPGDDRGKEYRATNLRTGASWTAPDSQHSCGGA